jgi:hypothetical protein
MNLKSKRNSLSGSEILVKASRLMFRKRNVSNNTIVMSASDGKFDLIAPMLTACESNYSRRAIGSNHDQIIGIIDKRER